MPVSTPSLIWSVLIAVVVVVGLIATLLRSLRVAQREHYLPGSVGRFSLRWWAWFTRNIAVGALCLVAVVASFFFAPAGLVVGVCLIVGPLGLGVRGRTTRLVWTRRVKVVASVYALIAVGLAAILILALGVAGLGVVAILTPLLVDLALAVDRPVENALARRFVRQARSKLDTIAPLVVAITGSYGKTTTKEYARHLISRTKNVVASPASYNNTAGLTRTVNDFLTPGTDVLIAEVGTYGLGEIEEICEWLRPSISAITAIGPVHLERMGSIDTIVSAKSEIFARSSTAVINVSCPELASVADEQQQRQRVVRVGEGEDAAITWATTGGTVVFRYEGDEVGDIEVGSAHPGNVAVAIAIAREVGVPAAHLRGQLASLPTPQHRQEIAVGERGSVVIDDTYNSNPAGASAALSTLQRSARPASRSVVVTPGMVELGKRQYDENTRFAREAAETASDLLIVGRTNKRALARGASGGAANVVFVKDRPTAVTWVRDHLGNGDVVLYENDLPDHFP